MAYGWVEVTDADTYFATRLNADEYWVSGAAKESALQTAYYDLVDCGIFAFPETATETMKRMQYEQALFRLQQGEGVDKRAGLQAQGVRTAFFVQEAFGDGLKGRIPICNRALQLGHTYRTNRILQAVDLARDEEEDVV